MESMFQSATVGTAMDPNHFQRSQGLCKWQCCNARNMALRAFCSPNRLVVSIDNMQQNDPQAVFGAAED